MNGLWTNSVVEIIRSAACTVTFSGSQVATKRKQDASSEDSLRGELPERLLSSVSSLHRSGRSFTSPTTLPSGGHFLVHEGKRETKQPCPASINDPQHWRGRAKEARALAEAIADLEAKRLMLVHRRRLRTARPASRSTDSKPRDISKVSAPSRTIRSNTFRAAPLGTHY